MKKFVLLFIVSLLMSSNGVVLTIDNHDFYLHDFLSRYPQQRWAQADSIQKDEMFADFVSRELCVLEAKKLGFQHDPSVAVKMRNHSLQILVNESYEQLVAKPLISSSDLEVAKKYAKKTKSK